MKQSEPFYPYVYLHITTQDPLILIEEHFGCKSEGRSWSNGDPRLNPKTKQQYGNYTWSSWKLESNVPEGQDIDKHLRKLWKRLEPLRQQMINRPKHWKAVLQFVASFDGKDAQLQFSAGHLTTAAYYDFETDFDFYYDDFGDDQTSPYWRWE